MTGSDSGNLAQIYAVSTTVSGLINMTVTGTSTMNSFSRIHSLYAGAHMVPVVDLTFADLSLISTLGSAVINSAQDVSVRLLADVPNMLNGDLYLNSTLDGATIQASKDVTVETAGLIHLESFAGGGKAQIMSSNMPPSGLVTVNANDLVLISNAAEAQIFSLHGPVTITVNNTTHLEAAVGSTAGVKIEANDAGNNLSLTTRDLNILTFASSATINGDGNVTVHATGGDISVIANGTTNAHIQCSSVTLGDQLTITADAPGGSFSVVVEDGFSFITGSTCPATVTLNGDLSLQTTKRGVSVLAAAFFGGTGDLVVSARNISTQGGNVAGGVTGLGLSMITTGVPVGGGGNGSITLTSTGSTGVTITGGTFDNTMSGIYTFGGSSTNDIQVTLTNPSANLTITANAGGGLANAFAGIGTGGMTVVSGMIGPVNQGGGSLTIDVGGNVILSAVSSIANRSAEIRANSTAGPFAGALLVKAGGTIDIGANSRIVNNNPAGTGTLTLVTDNLNLAPAIGSGTFMLGAGGTFSTALGQSLFVYTSTYQPANINAQINGSPFIVETVCVDSDTAQWGIYYQDMPNNPNAKIGLPYTFFYKSCYVPPAVIALETTGTVINDKFVQSISESFRDWSYLWDNPGFAMRTIEIGYDNLERVKEWLSPDALSSFDLPSWSYSFYAQTHRDYHLLKLDHRL